MKIVFLDKLTLGNDISLEEFNKFGEVVTYEHSNEENTAQRISDADIVVTNKVVINKETMKKVNLKLICIAATGKNNIDLEYAKEINLPVMNVAGYSTSSVAQLTFALVLELIQKTSYYSSYVKEGKWEKSPIFTNLDKPFNELDGKRWGIIGLGNIGLKVASIAKSFGCNVHYYSTSGANNNTQYTQDTLEDLIKKSDIISIHAPLNEQTKNLINKKNLNKMKDKSILINVGRGGIINEEDLAKVIDKKEIYCALDVLEKEPIDMYNPLRCIKEKDRLVITPHIAWASIEARNRLMQGIIKNIQSFLDSKK